MAVDVVRRSCAYVRKTEEGWGGGGLRRGEGTEEGLGGGRYVHQTGEIVSVHTACWRRGSSPPCVIL